MPQADDDLRARMNERFGSPIHDEGPRRYLREAGYTLSRDWTWSKPGIMSLQDMTRDEFECLLFLVHEWDFGALTPQPFHAGGTIDWKPGDPVPRII